MILQEVPPFKAPLMHRGWSHQRKNAWGDKSRSNHNSDIIYMIYNNTFPFSLVQFNSVKWMFLSPYYRNLNKCKALKEFAPKLRS